VEYPLAQKFTKTDLAKFEHSWGQYPHLVSRGAEKNFREFAINRGRQRTVADEQTFRDVISRAIIFRSTEKIVSGLGLVGYRANVVAYSIAYLAHVTQSRVDLDVIWQKQRLPGYLADAIAKIASPIYAEITNPPAGGNVGEWCKKEQCWESIRNLVIRLDPSLREKLVDPTTNGTGRLRTEDAAAIDRVTSVGSESWYGIAQWARETGSLEPWQRGLAFSLGRLGRQRKAPTAKQAIQGVKILEEADRAGFAYQGLTREG
jgi:hypothetical protein